MFGSHLGLWFCTKFLTGTFLLSLIGVMQTNLPKDITPTAWIAFHFANTHAFSVGGLESETFSRQRTQKHAISGSHRGIVSIVNTMSEHIAEYSFVHLGSKGSCSDDYNDEDDKCQHHWQEGHLVTHRFFTGVFKIKRTGKTVKWSNLPSRVSLCFDKVKEAVWIEGLTTRSQSDALQVCDLDQL